MEALEAYSDGGVVDGSVGASTLGIRRCRSRATREGRLRSGMEHGDLAHHFSS